MSVRNDVGSCSCVRHRQPRPCFANSDVSPHPTPFLLLFLAQVLMALSLTAWVRAGAGACESTPVTYTACAALYPLQCRQERERAHSLSSSPAKAHPATAAPVAPGLRGQGEASADPLPGTLRGRSLQTHNDVNQSAGMLMYPARRDGDAPPRPADAPGEQAQCEFSAESLRVLREVFAALNGSGWRDCAVPWTNTSDVSRWCHVGTTPPPSCYLKLLIIGIKGLAGTLPASLGDITQLQHLYVESNALLSGTIPASLGRLSQLQFLYLNNNAILSGTIPSSLGYLSQLKALYVSNDPLLSGTIPSSIGNLTRLQNLGLHANALVSGTIPSSFTNLTRTMYLYLNSNSLLSGTIPADLGRLSMLWSLNIYLNPLLSGTIPSSFGNMSRLHDLQLYSNPRLSGTIPPSLGDVQLSSLHLFSNPLLSGTIPPLRSQSMQYLYLYDNSRLSGTIPSDLGILSRLGYIYLWATPLLSGTLPPSLANAPSLRAVMVYSNPLLSGTLPADLGGLSGLQTLRLFSNPLLSGTLPLSLGNLTQLRILDLHSTRLSGTIPPSLHGSSALQVLDLSDASGLSGSMPRLNASALTTLRLSRTNVSGELPSDSALPQLAVMELAHTRISGSIPDSVCSWSNIEKIDLSFNQLSGSLPVCMKQLSKLNVLTVSGNRLSGSFVSVLPLQLRGAYLNHNAFTYDSNDCFASNTSLEVLDLSDTYLSTTFWKASACYLRSRLQVLRMKHAMLSGVLDFPRLNYCSAFSQFIGLGNYPHIALSSFDVSYNNVSGILDLSLQCCVCQPAVSMQQRLPFLSSFSLSHTLISVHYLPSAVQSVQLMNVAQVTDVALEQAFKSPVLQQVDLQTTASRPDTRSFLGLVHSTTRTVTYPDTHVTCPQWQTTASNGSISIDLGFFGYKQCKCTQPTAYWRTSALQCEPCPSPGRLRCDASVLDASHTVLADYYPLFTHPCSDASMGCLPQASFARCLASGICAVPAPASARPAAQPPLITGYYCAEGHDPRSRLCSMCLPNYFLYGTSCGACYSWTAAVVPLIVFVCLFGYVHFLRRRVDSPSLQGHANSDSESPSVSAGSFTSLLIVFYWLQLVYLTTESSSSSSASASQGHAFGLIQSLAMFHPWGVDCTVPGLKQHHLELVLTLPFTLTVVLCAFICLMHHVRPTRAKLQDVLVFGCRQTFEILYLPVCAAVFQSLTRHRQSSGEDFLERAPYRSCGDTALATLAILTLSYFVCGYPVYNTFYHYRKSRQRSRDDATRQKIRLWWWEPCLLRLRSVYVSVVISTLPLQHPLIPLLIYIALLLNVLLQIHLSPYTVPANNRLSVVTLTSLLLIYLCTMIDDNSYSSVSRDVVIILAFSLTLLYSVITVAPGAVRSIVLYVCGGSVSGSRVARRGSSSLSGYLELLNVDVDETV